MTGRDGRGNHQDGFSPELCTLLWSSSSLSSSWSSSAIRPRPRPLLPPLIRRAPSRFLPLFLMLLLAASPAGTGATVLIFYTDSNGVTHAEVRHDLSDCGFANVNPSVDCFPWFGAIATTGAGTINGGTRDDDAASVIVNDMYVDPAVAATTATDNGSGHYYYDYDYDYDHVPRPETEDVPYDFYLVRKECLLRGGTKLSVTKVDVDKSDMVALTRLASAAVGSSGNDKGNGIGEGGGGGGGNFKVLSVPSSTKEKSKDIIMFGDNAVTMKRAEITQQHGEILIDGVLFEVE